MEETMTITITDEIRELVAKARAGDPDSQFFCAMFFRQFVETERSAYQFLEAAADQNYMRAEYQLAYCILQGIYYEKDVELARERFLDLAQRGCVNSMFALGSIYIMGDGIPYSYPEGFSWCQMAALNGHPKAQLTLGWVFYYAGRAVPRDYHEAFKWVERAANHGDSDAQAALGTMYARGHGCDKDYALALYWLHIAKLMGNEKGIQPMLNRCFHWASKEDVERAKKMFQADAPIYKKLYLSEIKGVE
jgi:TPR repeat protein